MELTGVCKDAFDKWRERHCEYSGLYSQKYIPTDLTKYPFSMQYGVYVSFFDSVDINFGFQKNPSGRYVLRFYYTKWMKHFDSIYEARTEAIKKANEIFNNEKSV